MKSGLGVGAGRWLYLKLTHKAKIGQQPRKELRKTAFKKGARGNAKSPLKTFKTTNFLAHFPRKIFHVLCQMFSAGPSKEAPVLAALPPLTGGGGVPQHLGQAEIGAGCSTPRRRVRNTGER